MVQKDANSVINVIKVKTKQKFIFFLIFNDYTKILYIYLKYEIYNI